MSDAARRPADDTRCPTCGGSAHALDVVTAPKFGGRDYQHCFARKRMDEAWAESDRLATDLDATYSHLRALVGYEGDVNGLRHAIAGLLPETRELTAEERETFGRLGPGYVERLDAGRTAAWAELGFPLDDDGGTDAAGGSGE